ncbi:MAG: hypothetical protein M3Q29_18410 [Chloroflexota bacterium]|nr:hypothetical protein [Chloroflexota bacterium]
MEKYQTHEHDETVTIEIGKAVALALDSLLDRWENSEDDSYLQIEHDAEWHALSVIKAALETQLAELFLPDYLERVEAARRKVVERWRQVDG